MNRRDIALILIFVIISLSFLMFINKTSDGATKAFVYYKNDKVLSIDLTVDEVKTYEVEATNGLVIIESKKGMIRVLEEESPYNICSNQGFAKYSHEVIVCLPNDIVITLEGNSDIDTVIRW